MAYMIGSGTLIILFFQMVIMQCVWLVTGAKTISMEIDAQLKSWIKGAFDKLVCDSYASATGYLGWDQGNKIAKQIHRTLFNLVLRVKLRKVIKFVCKWESGRVLVPDEFSSHKMGVTEKSIATKNSPHFLRWRCTEKCLLLFPWIVWRMWSNILHKTVWGFQAPVVWTWKFDMVAFKFR